MLRGNYVNQREMCQFLFISCLPMFFHCLRNVIFGQAVDMFVSLLFEFDTDVGYIQQNLIKRFQITWRNIEKRSKMVEETSQDGG